MKIIAVIYATSEAAKRKPEKKNSGLYGIQTLDLCDMRNWMKTCTDIK